jgi:hypothetical protein
VNHNHKYLDYMYTPFEEVEHDGDNIKIWHDIKNIKTGEQMTADFTPYCYMSKNDFKNFVDLGFPGRKGSVSPLNSDTLRRMRTSK